MIDIDANGKMVRGEPRNDQPSRGTFANLMSMFWMSSERVVACRVFMACPSDVLPFEVEPTAR